MKGSTGMGRKLWAASALLCISLLLTGCTTREEVAEKILKERYGEEFVVHKTWSSGSDWATCSPKNDRNVVFEMEFSRDDGIIWHDKYVESVVSLQISQKLRKELQKYFLGCYVHTETDYTNQGSYLSFGNIQKVTPGMYAERYPTDHYLAYVYVNQEELQYDTLEEEYLYFSEMLQEEIEAGILPNVTIILEYVNAGQQNQIRQYFRTHYRGGNWNWEYSNIMGETYEWGFSYFEHGRPTGKINVTYEEYKELRMGGM